MLLNRGFLIELNGLPENWLSIVLGVLYVESLIGIYISYGTNFWMKDMLI